MVQNIITATNYTSQLAEALRQQKQAEAMQEQANAPIEIQSYKGVQAPIPWTALLAKGLGVVGSKVKEGRALKRQGELDKFKTDEIQRQFANLLAPVAVGEQPGFRPMSNGSQLASALASANAPANVAGMAPTAGAGGMPGPAPNADLAAALGGAGRMSAGGPPGVSMNGPSPGGMPMMPTQAMPPVRPAPMGAPMGAPLAPIQTAAPMAATTRSANSQEMTQRAAGAMASPFDTVRALGVNTLERAQGLEDEERKLGQAVELKRQTNDLDRIEKSKELSDLRDNINKSNFPQEDKDKYLNYSFLGVEGLKDVIAADTKRQNSGIVGQYINAIDNGLVPSTTTLAQFADMTKGTLGGTKTLAPGTSLVGGNAPPSAFGPKIESTVAGLVPGAVITSDARSPYKNRAVNGVSNSLHMTDNARDYRPPPGMTTAQMAASLKAKMPGYDVLDEGTHVHVEPGPQMAGSGGGVNVLYKAPDRPRAISASSASAWALTPEETAAINKAGGESRVDVSRLNSRTAKIQAQALIANPGLNLMNNHGIAAMLSNPAFQTKAMIADSLPDVLENVREAGKKLKFSDVQFLGKLQAWKAGQFNDPDFINYMGQRTDALLTITNVMRASGATDQSIKSEMKASPETMSPRAFDAWYAAQMKSLKPRLDRMAPLTVRPPGGAAPAGASPATGNKAPPPGMDPTAWAHMTPAERAKF
jgi:hypothetical protein